MNNNAIVEIEIPLSISQRLEKLTVNEVVKINGSPLSWRNNATKIHRKNPDRRYKIFRSGDSYYAGRIK